MLNPQLEKYKSLIQVASNTNYTNQYIESLKNITISEWDIHSAGLSVIKFRKLLSEEAIKELEQLPKDKRTVKEGLLQRKNPKISEEINETLSKARQAFCIQNNIDPKSILSIKKDAIFLINQKVEKPIVKDFFEFRKKNSYTSYIKLAEKRELFYNSFENKLDLKGFPRENIEKTEVFWDSIKRLISSWEKNNQEIVFEQLKSFRRKYLLKQLPLENYREVETGAFRIGQYLFDEISENEKSSLDISQNYLNIVFPLIQKIL